jgi:hypothetical protein
MNLRILSLAGVAVTLLAAPAAAHHSFAMFDQNKVVTLTGTVTEFEWVNPHSWLHFTVDANGQKQEWSLELASIGQQTRVGWTATTVKPGDRITVEFNPLRDGSRGGTLLAAVLPDGRKLGHGGMPANPLGRE